LALTGQSAGVANPSTTVEFCDTNILVYALDETAGEKRRIARELVGRLWEMGVGAISVQVLQELFVTLIRRLPVPDGFEIAQSTLSDLTAWKVVEPTAQDVLAATACSRRWKVSFWDAMLLRTASQAGARIVWSEDLNPGQRYDDLVVHNPFASPRN
jgi:predicted nucleic acid-binding protein